MTLGATTPTNSAHCRSNRASLSFAAMRSLLVTGRGRYLRLGSVLAVVPSYYFVLSQSQCTGHRLDGILRRNQCICRGSYGDRLRQFSVHRLPERDFRTMAIGPAPVPSVALSANLPAGSAAVRLRALRRVLSCLPDCNLRRPCWFALALHEEKSRTMDFNILAVVVPGRVDQRIRRPECLHDRCFAGRRLQAARAQTLPGWRSTRPPWLQGAMSAVATGAIAALLTLPIFGLAPWLEWATLLAADC